MKVRLWLPDFNNPSILLEDVYEFKQVDKDVSITTISGKQFYVRNEYYTRIFEDAEKLGYIKNVQRNLD
jgi:hypothetical protein